MLTELKLANFRIFDDEVTVRFRPITVFIGRNSSGKSSIIKFLLMLQQSLGTGKAQFLTPEGERVNLGVFSGLKNALTLKSNLFFELAADGPRTISFGDAISKLLTLPKNVAHDRYMYKTGATIPYDSSMILSPPLLFGTTVGGASPSYYRTVGPGHSGFHLVDNLSSNIVLQVDSEIRSDSNLLEVPTYDRTDMSSENADGWFDRAVAAYTTSMAQQQLSATLNYEINSIRHLSAVRDESQNIMPAYSPPAGDVGQNGQFALRHLQRMMTDNYNGYNFLIPYFEGIADIRDVGFTTMANFTTSFAVNKTTGASVHVHNYGFGVSQCLPILVQGAIMAPYTTLMVEQPEAQLHPTAQLELGSFFADLWKKRQVGSIVETHSDNILLRLRRLIAKGDLPSDDVSVAFFTVDEQNNNMPIVKNLDINEDGSMQPGLPMEFFGADIMEGLKLGARK